MGGCLAERWVSFYKLATSPPSDEKTRERTRVPDAPIDNRYFIAHYCTHAQQESILLKGSHGRHIGRQNGEADWPELTQLAASLNHPLSSSCFCRGKLRMRLPVAAKIALHSAGASGGTDGSPTPPQESPPETITVSTFGAPAIRTIR